MAKGKKTKLKRKSNDHAHKAPCMNCGGFHWQILTDTPNNPMEGVYGIQCAACGMRLSEDEPVAIYMEGEFLN